MWSNAKSHHTNTDSLKTWNRLRRLTVENPQESEFVEDFCELKDEPL